MPAGLLLLRERSLALTPPARRAQHYDTDDSGELDLEEFHQALEDLEIHLTPKEFRKLVAETDDEGEGKIELDEFKACAVRTSNAWGLGLGECFVWTWPKQRFGFGA